jgi:hypothetical protein
MTLYAPLDIQNGTYSATLDRQLADAIFGAQGVVTIADLKVAQRGAGANMSVDVAAGKLVVLGTDNAGQGKYLCFSDAITNVAIATAPGTGLSRIDLIVAQVRDADQNGGAFNDWIITSVAGVANASPVAPTAPASSQVLARVAVGANVTSIVNANITDFRTLAALQTGQGQRATPGGHLYASTQTVMASSTVPAQVVNMSADFLRGGVTLSSNGLVVPVAGIYQVSVAVEWQVAGSAIGSGALITQIKQNGSGVREWQSYNGATAVAGPGGTDLVSCAANDTITLYASQASGSNAGTRPNSGGLHYTGLSVQLVSV